MLATVSNAAKLQIEIGVATGLILAAVGWFRRWAASGVTSLVDDTKAIRGLLVTDEDGLGVMDRLDRIDNLIAERTPIFDEVRLQVAELVKQSDLIVDRTETLTPNGGSSMHDRINRIDDNTPDVKAGGPPHAARPSTRKAPAKKAAAKKAAAKKAAPRRRTTR